MNMLQIILLLTDVMIPMELEDTKFLLVCLSVLLTYKYKLNESQLYRI